MKTNIIYYTRTSGTKAVAKRISEQIDGQMFEVKDNEKWNGALGIIKGLFYSVTNKQVEVTYDKAALEADKLIVMSPLWLNGPSPAVKVLLDEVKHDNIHFVMTNHASPTKKALALYKSKVAGIKETYGITLKKNNEKDVIAQILTDIAK